MSQRLQAIKMTTEKIRSRNAKNDVTILAIQLLTPLEHKIFNIIPLNYSMLCVVAGTTISYSLLFIQYNIESPLFDHVEI